jgi:hypothetical protein
MFTKKFWQATAERVISSVAGGALSAIGTDAFDILEMDARAVVSIALGAGLVSLLKAFAANNIGAPGPSLGGVERLSGRHVA